MHFKHYTRKQLEKLPYRKNWAEEVICDSLIVLPLRRKHDSGFACMDFVAIVGDKPTVRLSGCSDVIHIEGIGGYGERIGGSIPFQIPVRGWSIDCLPNGLLRLFCANGTGWNKIKCGPSLSSFELYSAPSSAYPHERSLTRPPK